MDKFNIQVLFLHHNVTSKNKDVMMQNFNSFKKNNTDIVGIYDSDLKGLENAIPIPLNSSIPRGDRRWSPENVILNYALINYKNLNHSHYMFCEYDCYTECNINELCEPYKDYDIVVPSIVTYEKEPDWQWFENLKSIEDKNLLIGFRPSVFILFKKEALIKLAVEYQQNWESVKNLNSESRLGFLSKKLGFNISQFKDLEVNVSWFEINFLKNNKIYHPVKKQINEYQFIEFIKINPNSNKIGKWYFGRTEENIPLGIVCLNDNNYITEYINFNERFWEENGNDELLFYNGYGELTTKFKKSENNLYLGDYYYKNQIEKNKHFLRKINN